MRRRIVITLVLCLGATAGVVGVAASDGTVDEPLAEAGLDQSVEQGATVYLDAGGSVAPEGKIVGFEWEIERPDGTTTTPACRTCERTSFLPTETGLYNVTVTVTDNQGRVATDTLRVTVYEYEPPEVSVTGSKVVLVGDRPTINLTATAGDEELSSLTWFVDDQQYEAKFIEGNLTTDTITLSANEPGEIAVEAQVTDERGRSATDEHVFEVEDGEFGTGEETLVTEDGKYDLSSLSVEFTGSTSGLQMTPSGERWIREGHKLRYSIGLRTYEETTGETVLNQPFTQSTAEFPHLNFDSNPHDYGWWGKEPKGIRTISMGPRGGTVEADNPVSSTSLSFWTTGTGESRIYGAQTEFEIRPEKDEASVRREDNYKERNNNNNNRSNNSNQEENNSASSGGGHGSHYDNSVDRINPW